MIGGQLFMGFGCNKEQTTHRLENIEFQNKQTDPGNNAIVSEWGSPLPIPREIKGGNLVAQHTSAIMNSEQSTRVLGYQKGGILGPTISIQKGSLLEVELINQLNENSNIHWHGLTPPGPMDGYPNDTLTPGENLHYRFRVNNRSGTYWYHPHPIHHTAAQVYSGLAGLVLIRDEIENQLNLPAKEREIPLIIQDKRSLGASLDYVVNHHDIQQGILGDYNCVNGMHKVFLPVGTVTYRLRILNGANARVYDLALSPSFSFCLIGNDGGLLETSQLVDTLTLAPGERADVLVNFSQQKINTSVELIDKNNNDQRIMQFYVRKELDDDFVLPEILSTIEKIKPETAVKTRKFKLSSKHMMGMHKIHRINDKTYDAKRVDETVKSNTVEIWEFDNSNGSIDHPMHLHGVQFQMLDRKGGRNRLLPTELGYKDTFLIKKREKVSIIIPFGGNKGKCVFHCHNLEHENDGMMLRFEIT